MKSFLTTAVALAGAMLVAVPALAAPGIAPPDTLLTASGASHLVKNGNEIWACTLSFALKTGPAAGSYATPRASGGMVLSGSATGTNCQILTVDATSFSINSYFANGGIGYNTDGGNGVLHGLTIRKSGVVWCQTSADVPFTYYNNAAGASDMYFDYVNFGGNCNIGADMKTCPDANVVQ